MNKRFLAAMASSAMRATLIAACVMSISAATEAEATTITQTLTISAISQPNSNRYPTNSFAEFDTALGTLNNIQVSLSGFAAFELDSSTPAHRIDLVFAGSNQPIVPGIAFATGGVATLSFTGNSPVSNFGFLEGTGTTTLDLALSGVSVFVAVGGFTGNITYDYSPAVAVPLRGSLPLSAAGLCALGLLVWRMKRKAALAA